MKNSAVFNATGSINEIIVIRGLPYGLTEKAIEVAKKIRFQPAVQNGRPVSVRENLEFTFSLRQAITVVKTLREGSMDALKIAGYQAPLLAAGSMGALDLIRARVRTCEEEGVMILCCPEAILGGLADQSEDPVRFAISVRTGQLDAILAPLASDVTTTIVGFTELGEDGHLYNAAAIFHRGTVAGVYRKLFPVYVFRKTAERLQKSC